MARDHLTVADVLGMHSVLMQRYGGAPGVRDPGALEAALFRPQTGYYEDIVAEAAALMESLAINHPFVDGNKRIAFAAADALLHPAPVDNFPNVVLEAMACGTPVVASNIPGNPEVVRSRPAGLITKGNTPADIVEGVRSLFDPPPDREATRHYAEPFGWDETTAGQLAIFRRVTGRG